MVIGYHGCDEQVAHDILLGKKTLESSKNKYDWLGAGIYFWEHGPQRSLEWATQRSKTAAAIKKPSVVGAYIQLGNCFDLLDTRYTKILGDAYPKFADTLTRKGVPIPKNVPAADTSLDHILRFLDCAMVNWCLDELQKGGIEFHTVRCVFMEGEAVFPGSKIMRKSHIQIAVRDPNCILGYFRPTLTLQQT